MGEGYYELTYKAFLPNCEEIKDESSVMKCINKGSVYRIYIGGI
jgi:hypothetical protein